MNIVAVLSLAFLIGMRHATDADHVVAVSTVVSRERSFWAAGPIGILWGIGHSLTILSVGSLIVIFGVVIPPHVGLGFELGVALMLVLLGFWNLSTAGVPAVDGNRRSRPQPERGAEPSRLFPLRSLRPSLPGRTVRPILVGVAHGLAGSAAVALPVLGVVRGPWHAVGFLLVFGAGTIAGMLVVTLLIALPLAASSRHFERLPRILAVVTGVASIAFGSLLAYQVAFAHSLFTDHPQWTPE